MIGEMIARVGHNLRPFIARDPFSNVYGLARSILAVGTAGTIASNATSVVFTPVAGLLQTPKCDTAMLKLSLFCLAGPRYLELWRWLCVAMLVLVASGWRPRFTAIPHAWISYSFFSSCTIIDGGDQISVVLTMLLLPIALLDSREWHWQRSLPKLASPLPNLVAWSAICIIRIQVAAVYFVSGISKLRQPEWRDGTAMYYWLLTFAHAPNWAVTVLSQPVILVVLTWGAIAVDVALGVAIVASRRTWPALLTAGIVFHLLIGFFFDLWSFVLAMIAALVLYLRQPDQPFKFAWLKKLSAIPERSGLAT